MIGTIDLRVDKKKLEKAVQRCRERNIIIPTLKQQKDPSLVPDKIKERLKKIGSGISTLQSFRITWKTNRWPWRSLRRRQLP